MWILSTAIIIAALIISWALKDIAEAIVDLDLDKKNEKEEKEELPDKNKKLLVD